MTYPDPRDDRPDPPIRPINWPRLMRSAERERRPVLRIAPDGTQRVLRTLADLDGWPSQPPATHAGTPKGSTR